MRIIGLTGSIAMGKSVAAGMLRRMGVPVYDADRAVHALTARGGAAVAAVGAAFPGVVVDGAVDRPALGARVFADPAALKRLEAILHPAARRVQARMLGRWRRQRRRVVALDVPLLFETGQERRCSDVLVVSAPAFLQRQRALRRPGMTAARLAEILRRQMPDAEKRRRADRVIPSGLGRAVAWRALRRALRRSR